MATYSSIIGSLELVAWEPAGPNDMLQFKCGWEIGYALAFALDDEGEDGAYNCSKSHGPADATLSLDSRRVYLLRPHGGYTLVSCSTNFACDNWVGVARKIRKGSV